MKTAIIVTLCFIGSLMAQEVAVTVYNQNLALVRETRQLEIPSGLSTIAFTDVAAQIDPTSVHFKSIDAPGKLNILEQNFEYDLVDAQKIMGKYIDHKIRLVLEKGEVFDGTLLSTSGSNVVLKSHDGRIQVVQTGSIQHFDFPELPEGLITRPTLVWSVQNKGSSDQKTELSYLTRGMNWHAEYVAVAAADDKSIDLSGWVSLENRSGATYKNARLKLVAGDVNLVQEQARRGRMVKYAEQALAAADQFEEKSFFEYHLYTLQRQTTLKQNQTKQISLFPAARTATEKIYVYDGNMYGKKVRVHLAFQNRKKDGLGLPLPKGKIRVYKEDDDGSLEFIGEDLIDHTPENENVRLFLGNAFDIVGERTQQSSRRISDHSREESIKITLRNHKKSPVDVLVVEHFYGDWQFVGQPHPLKKKDARTAEGVIKVPAKGQFDFEFTVLYRY